MMNSQISAFFAAMWRDYLNFAPSAAAIHAALGGGEIINDHVALRTFNHPMMGLDVLGRHLEDMGYRVGGHYVFRAKKLRARHYQHPDPAVPKVFISELLLEQCSASLQAIVARLISRCDPAAFANASVLYSGAHWQASSDEYKTLLVESEYAAWLSAFGFRANHFTVSVNQLPGFQSVAEVNAALKAKGFPLNTSGGEIKGSAAVLLEQSSTLADVVDVSFSDTVLQIPACFYEFAYRFPQADGSLFPGFVEASADKIFESTDAR